MKHLDSIFSRCFYSWAVSSPQGEPVDIGWLKGASYLLFICSFIFFAMCFAQPWRIGRAIAVTGCFLCLLFAALLWQAQEQISDLYSPRVQLIGTVAAVQESRHIDGSFDDVFSLSRNDGTLTPDLDTGRFGKSVSSQPISMGDTLNVTYRVWDNKIVSIFERNGAHPGWTYRR
jgi:hypothetical protein